jgi:hypothetical protein
MTHALLVADQHVEEGFLNSAASRPQKAPGAEWMRARQTLQGYDLLQVRVKRAFRSVDIHRSEAHQAVEHLARFQERAQRDRQFSQEMNWLAQHRRTYAGRWIALEGDRLLAVGATAREVFAHVGERPRPPLVIQIENEEMPFAGW